MSADIIKSLSSNKFVAIFLGIVAIIALIMFFGAKLCSVNILGVNLQFPCEDPKPEEIENTSPISGTWVAKAGEDNAQIDVIITVASNCEVGNICGTINLPSIDCQASIYLRNINGNHYDYDAVSHQGNCGPAGNEYLELKYNGTLEYSYNDRSIILRRK